MSGIESKNVDLSVKGSQFQSDIQLILVNWAKRIDFEYKNSSLFFTDSILRERQEHLEKYRRALDVALRSGNDTMFIECHQRIMNELNKWFYRLGGYEKIQAAVVNAQKLTAGSYTDQKSCGEQNADILSKNRELVKQNTALLEANDRLSRELVEAKVTGTSLIKENKELTIAKAELVIMVSVRDEQINEQNEQINEQNEQINEQKNRHQALVDRHEKLLVAQGAEQVAQAVAQAEQKAEQVAQAVAQAEQARQLAFLLKEISLLRSTRSAASASELSSEDKENSPGLTRR